MAKILSSIKWNQRNKGIWVFLSHSNEDYDKVRKVRNLLEEQGLRPIMFFLKCLNDDDEIDELIKREIDCRTRFILCDSENARNSKWVHREIEYIKSLQKPYEIINLAKNEEEILNQLKEVKRRSRLVISYAHKDRALASDVYRRLSKYDYDVFIDFNDLTNGEDFANQIESTIKSSVENGQIIALLTEEGIQSEWIKHEIEIAREYEKVYHYERKSIIPIVIGEKVPECYSDLQCIKISSETEDLSNKIVDAILKTILAPGEILTYCRNFRRGINHPVDIIESEKLAKLYFDIANNSSTPTGELAVGYCYEYGIGVTKDLKVASSIYSSVYHTEGIGKDALLRVNRKIDELANLKYK